uniref:Uncharacterized protein n=1 Tax=Arundo donax TaxID=35708 RepID=A0A0A9F0A6_ARUDO
MPHNFRHSLIATVHPHLLNKMMINQTALGIAWLPANKWSAYFSQFGCAMK